MLPAMESSSKRQNSISVNENVNKTDISRDLNFYWLFHMTMMQLKKIQSFYSNIFFISI